MLLRRTLSNFFVLLVRGLCGISFVSAYETVTLIKGNNWIQFEIVKFKEIVPDVDKIKSGSSSVPPFGSFSTVSSDVVDGNRKSPRNGAFLILFLARANKSGQSNGENCGMSGMKAWTENRGQRAKGEKRHLLRPLSLIPKMLSVSLLLNANLLYNRRVESS